MWLLVGLGNPGKDYENTRHNVGFMAADEIIRRFSFSGPNSKFHAEFYSGNIESHKVLILKPQTYMNKSGISVAEAVKFYKIPLDKVIVFQDELDLPNAKIRVKKGGGAGGHNGIKDIDNKIGKDYHRVRIGIDHPGDRNRVSDYVLKPFNKEQALTIEELNWRIAENINLLLENDSSLFMSKITPSVKSEKT